MSSGADARRPLHRSPRPDKEPTMSHFLDRLMFFRRVADDFPGGHGIVTREDRR
jgi:hypothetical protein